MSIQSDQSPVTSTFTSPKPKKNASKNSSPPCQKKLKSTLDPENDTSSNILQNVPRNPYPSQTVPRKKQLLKRLKVSEAELAAAPNITSILKENKFGVRRALEAMRFSDEPLILAFLSQYDVLSERDRQELSIEAIALAAKLNIRHLWGEMQLAIRQYSASSVLTIAANSHPEIVKRRIIYAKTPGGYRDRDKLDEMLGAIKPGQGSTFIGKYFAATTKEMPEDDSEPEKVVDDIEAIFPECSVMQERVQPMRQKVLEAGK